MTIGKNGNHVCYRKNMDSFEFLWMNILRETHGNIGSEMFTTKSPISWSGRLKSWKQTELTRICKEKSDHFKPLFASIHEELTHIKNTVKMHVNHSEMRPVTYHFPIQFFNLDIESIEQQKEENMKNLECKQNELENEFLMIKTQIARIQKNLIDGFKCSQIRIREIFNELFIENYPLTHLDGKLLSVDIMEILIANPELFQQICKLEPWIRCNVIKKNELKWFQSSADVCSEGIERFSAAVSKIIDLKLSTHISWAKDFTSGLTDVDEEIHDVTNENKVKLHNLKVYVRILLNIFIITRDS